jgi:NitT/TauT family transport system substrate-binding protein
MFIRQRFVAGVAAATAVALLSTAACSSTPHGSSATKPVTPVTVVNGFGTTPRELTPAVGDKQGIWRKAGLQLTFQQGQPGVALQAVATGRAQLADIDFASAARAMAPVTGTPTTGFTVAGVMQDRSMTALFSKKSSNITSPKDLEGKTVASAPAAASQTLFPSVCQLAGVDQSKVHWITGDSKQLPAWLKSGKVQAIAGYISDQPVIDHAVGSTNALLYIQQLGDLLGSVIILNTAWLHRHPAAARAAVQAFFDGVKWSTTHAQQAGQIIHNSFPTVAAGPAADVLTAMAPYVPDTPQFDETKLEHAITLLSGAHAIGPQLSPEHPDGYADLDLMGKKKAA